MVTNPMDHRHSWFPSVFKYSSRSSSLFKFIYPKSSAEETDESMIDNACQMSDLRANGTQNVYVPLIYSERKMPDLRANRTQRIVNNGYVPLIDNASQIPDPRENNTHGTNNNGFVPVNSTMIDGLNKKQFPGIPPMG